MPSSAVVPLLLTCLCAAQALAAEPELVIQRGHEGAVTSLAVSADGRLVVTGSRDDTARLWDAATGEELRCLRGHMDDVTSLAFSPDGRWVATGSRDDSVRIWEVASGSEHKRLVGHAFAVTSVAFSPDGSTLVSGSEDHHLIHWDLESGEEIRKLGGRPDYAEVTSVVITPDGRKALSGHLDGTARLWDLRRGREIRTLSSPAGDDVLAVATDGIHAVTGHRGGQVHLWDIDSGERIADGGEHGGDVTSATLDAGGRRAWTSGADGALRIWEIGAAGEAAGGLVLGAPIAAAASVDGDFLVAIANSVQRIAADGDEEWALRGLTAPVRSVTFLDGGQLLITAGLEELVQLRQSQHGSLVRRVGTAAGDVAISRDGRRLASCDDDGRVHLWDLVAAEETAVLTGHEGRVHAVAFSLDGSRVLTGGQDGSVRLWDASSGAEIRVLVDRGPVVETVDISADGALGVAGGWDETTRVWDLSSGDRVLELRGHTHYVGAVAFTADATRLATGGGDNTVRIWDTESAEELLRLDAHDDAVRCLAFSPAGGTLLSGGGEGVTRLWDVDSGRVLHAWSGHGEPVDSVAFAPSGRLAASASADGTARLWDLQSGAAIGSVVALDGGAWATIDPLGRFDGERPVRGLHWVVGSEAVALWQTESRYFRPGLLGSLLRGEEATDVQPFRATGLHPLLVADAPEPGRWVLAFSLVPRGGGVGRTRLFLNGRPLDTEPVEARSRDLPAYSVDLSGAAAVFAGQANEIRLVTCNEAGDLCGRETVLEWYAPGTAVRTPPRLWGIVAGASHFRGDRGVDLRFSSRDARQLATEIGRVAGRQYGPQNVHITTLADRAGDDRPTRANLQAAFGAATASSPDDVLVVYLAGYSTRVDPEHGHLALVPSGMDASRPAIPEGVVTVRQLAEWSQAIPARSRVLILDTCAIASAELSASEHGGGEASRAAHLLHDEGGFEALVGRASDQASCEATTVAGGWIATALLEQMRGHDGPVEAHRLLTGTSEAVQAAAHQVTGVQAPVVSSEAGASFVLGLGSASVDTPPAVRPILERPDATWRHQAYDALELEFLLGDALRGLLWTGEESVVYADTTGVPGAYRPVIEYEMDQRRVDLTVVIQRDGATVLTHQRTASRDALEELATELAVWIVESVAALPVAAP
jgi:WD40 repeat protein